MDFLTQLIALMASSIVGKNSLRNDSILQYNMFAPATIKINVPLKNPFIFKK